MINAIAHCPFINSVNKTKPSQWHVRMCFPELLAKTVFWGGSCVIPKLFETLTDEVANIQQVWCFVPTAARNVKKPWENDWHVSAPKLAQMLMLCRAWAPDRKLQAIAELRTKLLTKAEAQSAEFWSQIEQFQAELQIVNDNANTGTRLWINWWLPSSLQPITTLK